MACRPSPRCASFSPFVSLFSLSLSETFSLFSYLFCRIDFFSPRFGVENWDDDATETNINKRAGILERRVGRLNGSSSTTRGTNGRREDGGSRDIRKLMRNWIKPSSCSSHSIGRPYTARLCSSLLPPTELRPLYLL